MDKKTQKPKIDARIRILIENGVKQRYRTFFVIVGNNARQQVVNLHFLLTRTKNNQRPSVLWCYNKELGFISDQARRLKAMKEIGSENEKEKAENDPFHLFLSATDVNYCFFKETQRILGQTFGMLVLQDFEGITPNTLARTIETVEGGGIVVLLLPNLTSLKQLYTMQMDIHANFREENAISDSEPFSSRFNERFILSLATNKCCLCVDDQLQILPLSSHVKQIKPISVENENLAVKEGNAFQIVSEKDKQLQQLQKQLLEIAPTGALLAKARTLDQAKAVMSFIEAISEKTLQSTVVLTASRGRGKSAALGLSLASAIYYGYSNIFVTAPAPENVATLFSFILVGFDVLGYKEGPDYEVVKATNKEWKNTVIRINVKRNNRQTIQYVKPSDYTKAVSQAELVCIDEAAAIPLPIVKKWITGGKQDEGDRNGGKLVQANYLVFLSSTINGYEGTGRSLSLKLIEELKKQQESQAFTVSMFQKNQELLIPEKRDKKSTITSSTTRKLTELSLDEPIRYAEGDSVESWLHDLLLLDANSAIVQNRHYPHAKECSLYYVNRDTLFSYHKASESFLKSMMSLYVSSHYKNTPNDLQIMADAPNHHLFVLMKNMENTDEEDAEGTEKEQEEEVSELPDIYCVVQVSLEGKINKDVVLSYLSHGKAPTGDLVPYVLCRQFVDANFAELSGSRIVRIATHPEYQGKGYGSRAMELLSEYYQEKLFVSAPEAEESKTEQKKASSKANKGNENILTEVVAPRESSKLPPLLQSLAERKPEPLDYLGVSYGLTKPLFNFWKGVQFMPVYLRQTPNAVTGEYTCIMLRTLEKTSQMSRELLLKYNADYKNRMLSLFGYQFREFDAFLALNILDVKKKGENDANNAARVAQLKYSEFKFLFSPTDYERIKAYAASKLDYHVIVDLLPNLSRLYFSSKIPPCLNYTEAAVLLGLGLQQKTVSDVEVSLSIQANQVMAFLLNAIKKFTKFFKTIEDNKTTTTTTSVIIEEPEEVAKEGMDVDDLLSDEEEGGKDFEKEKEKIQKTQEIFGDIFEKPLDKTVQSIDQKAKASRKRKRDEDQKEEEPEKDDKEDEDILKQKIDSIQKDENKDRKKRHLETILNNADYYKITSKADQELKKAVESGKVNDQTGEVVGVEYEGEKKAITKNYMLKSKKELKVEEKDAKKAKEKRSGKKRKSKK